VQLGNDLLTKPDWDTRVSTTVSVLQAAGLTNEDAASVLSAAILRFYRKLVIADDYRPSARLPSVTRVTLVRASESSPQAESLGLDYGLGSLCDGAVDVRVVKGSHETFVTGSESAAEVSSIIGSV
jgi:hypothetical protein